VWSLANTPFSLALGQAVLAHHLPAV